MKLFFLYTFLLLLLSTGSYAQHSLDIEGILEHYDIEDESEYENLYDVLTKLHAKPLNLNTATFDSLKLLGFLSDKQIDNILDFRKKANLFTHINELLLVPGLAKDDVDAISYFVFIYNKIKTSFDKLNFKNNKNEILLKYKQLFPKSDAYKIYSREELKSDYAYKCKENSRYLGPSFGTMIKAKLVGPKGLRYGFTCENDPGENYFTRNQKEGFDYFSFWLCVKKNTWLKSLYLGDYRVKMGQGLLMWGGFSSGKSSQAVANEKAATGFHEHSSSDEVNFLRGVAVSLSPFKNIMCNLFASYKKTDASVSTDDMLEEEDIITAKLYKTGLHRSLNEISKKHKVKEKTLGASINWNTLYFKLGTSCVYYDFSPNLAPGKYYYQEYGDPGNNRFLCSIDYKTSYHRFYLFGETAFSNNGSLASINGLRWTKDIISLSLIYRYYQKDYKSYYASAFGEYSGASNEEGVYCGLECDLIKNLSLNLYFDRFRFFSPRYRARYNNPGYECLGELDYKFDRLRHILRYKFEHKAEDENGKPGTKDKSELRYQLYYKRNKTLELRTRMSYSSYKKASVVDEGFFVSQDVILVSRNDNFKTQIRLAYFDIDSYNARIYTYENNVLYAYSFPSFMHKGWRSYVNMSLKIKKRFTFYAKIGYSLYPHEESLGSNRDMTDGNSRLDITMQLRIKF